MCRYLMRIEALLSLTLSISLYLSFSAYFMAVGHVGASLSFPLLDR